MSTLCSYCNKLPGLFTLKNGKICCEPSYQGCPETKRKNSEGLKKSGRDYKEIYKNLPEETKDKMSWNKGKSFLSDNRLKGNKISKKIILKEKLLEYKCQKCNIIEWNNEPISLELDHIDGNNQNDSLENLRFLCPNCHSQTNTFRGRNINKGFNKVSDEELLNALQSETNVRKALLKVGLAPKGGNYERAYSLKIGAHGGT